MFDKLFEDDAMDISTDISVLSMMLAQEGLLEDEFKMNCEGEKTDDGRNEKCGTGIDTESF